MKNPASFLDISTPFRRNVLCSFASNFVVWMRASFPALVVCCFVLSLTSAFSCSAFAQTLHDQVKPFFPSMPTFPSSLRRMPWIPKPQQMILAVNRDGKWFLNGQSKTSRQALKEMKSRYRHAPTSSPPPVSPLLLVLDAKSSMRSLWQPMRSLLLLGTPRRFGLHWPAKDAVGVQLLLARQQAPSPVAATMPTPAASSSFDPTRLFVANLVFGLSTRPDDRSRQNRPARKWIVRVTTKGIWLSVDTPFARGCDLRQQIATRAELRAHPLPTCPLKDAEACISRCLVKLKEIFPDQKRLFFFVEKSARRNTTLQQLVSLSVLAEEARYPEQIWLFSHDLPLLPRR